MKLSTFAKSKNVSRQRIDGLRKEKRIRPMPEKDPVSGWWMVDDKAVILPPRKSRAEGLGKE